MIKRKCAWCGEEFEVKSLFSNDKYCDEHKKEAKREKTFNRVRSHYKRFKHSVDINKLGTDNTGPHPIIDFGIARKYTYLGCYIPGIEFWREGNVIQKLLKSNKGVSVIYKGEKTNSNVWIDYQGQAEYGEPAPLGIQRTHNYASFDDYVNTSLGYLMQFRPPCPECGCRTHYREVKRATISCHECGLLLSGPPSLGRFSYPDYIDNLDDDTSANHLRTMRGADRV